MACVKRLGVQILPFIKQVLSTHYVTVSFIRNLSKLFILFVFCYLLVKRLFTLIGQHIIRDIDELLLSRFLFKDYVLPSLVTYKNIPEVITFCYVVYLLLTSIL